MKKILTLIACVAFSVTMFGQAAKTGGQGSSLQEEVKNLKAKVETLAMQVSNMQLKLNQLADKNAEYKKALDIRQVLNATDEDGFQYGVLSAVGDKNTGKLTITLNLFNPGGTRRKQMNKAKITDYEGNIYQTYNYNYGNSENADCTIDANTSIKVKFFFENVPFNTNRIASLSVNAYGIASLDTSVNFRDIPIEWK